MKTEDLQNIWFILQPELLHPCDIIMEHDHSRLGELIEKKYHIHYTHAKLYVGFGSYIDIDGTVVKAQQVKRTLYLEKDDVIVLKYKEALSFQQQFKIIDFVRSEIGKEFHMPREVFPFAQSSDENEQNREYCVRLIAKAFEYAGVPIVEDSDYCTPMDIINSGHLLNTNVTLHEAELDDIQYAHSNCVINKQDDYTYELFDNIRKVVSADIQTEEQLRQFIIDNPSKDTMIYNAIKDLPYFTMLNQYHTDHPEEYDVQSLIKIYKGDALCVAYAISQSAQHSRESIFFPQLYNYCYLFGTYKFSTFKLFYELYKKLVADCWQREQLFARVFETLK